MKRASQIAQEARNGTGWYQWCGRSRPPRTPISISPRFQGKPSRHHHLVHEGGWTISGNADGELTFASPGGGRRLTGRPPPLRHETHRRARCATGAAVADPDDDPDRSTAD